jgi:hypothetical protein
VRRFSIIFPNELDGAKVIKCSTNITSNDFGYVEFNDENARYVYITAVAIAKYEDGEGYYIFSCDLNWTVIGDLYFFSLEEAETYAYKDFGIEERIGIFNRILNQLKGARVENQ